MTAKVPLTNVTATKMAKNKTPKSSHATVTPGTRGIIVSPTTAAAEETEGDSKSDRHKFQRRNKKEHMLADIPATIPKSNQAFIMRLKKPGRSV